MSTKKKQLDPTARVGSRRLLAAIVQAQDDYIKALTDECGELVGMNWAHGWRSSRIEEGKRLRAKIAKLKRESNDRTKP